MKTLTMVDSADNVGQYSSLAIGETYGYPVISYYDATNQALMVVHCTSVDCTEFDPPTMVDDAGNVGQYSSLAIGTDGYPVISYYDATNQTLMVVHCTRADCTEFDPPTLVDDAGNVGQYSSLAIGGDGNPVISYRDATNTSLKLVHCTNGDCTSVDAPMTVDNSGNVGQYSSLAIGTDGNPVISYRDSTQKDLKVAHCTSVDCSGGQTLTVVDSDGNVGNYTALAIGGDGNPVISYRDATNRALKVAHCTNKDCSGGQTLTMVDNDGNVGNYTALAIGTDGNPVISYRDSTNKDLKVAHCGTVGC